MGVDAKDWRQASQRASTLSGLELMLGDVVAAAGSAEQAVSYADQCSCPHLRTRTRVSHAHALHQAGRSRQAWELFRDAETLQASNRFERPSQALHGFRYCELLLECVERCAWAGLLRQSNPSNGQEAPVIPVAGGTLEHGPSEALFAKCHVAEEHATESLKNAESSRSLLNIAQSHLTLGRAQFYAAILRSFVQDASTLAQPSHDLGSVSRELDAAVAAFRIAGDIHRLPRGLLPRAWLRCVLGQHTGSESAQSDLDEAWEIAERGSMKLFLADIHLYRARLFCYRVNIRETGTSSAPYPWESAEVDLAAAAHLIEACSYHRRDEELADAKGALL